MSEPAFAIYSLSALVLCLNMLGLWGWSGAVRTKTKTTLNKEDVILARGNKIEVVPENPPEVARVLRAQHNAFVNIMPFLVLGLIYVINGCSARAAWVFFGSFTVLRLLHTVVYLAGKQPWRTIMFVLSSLPLIGVMVQVARGTIAHLM